MRLVKDHSRPFDLVQHAGLLHQDTFPLEAALLSTEGGFQDCIGSENDVGRSEDFGVFLAGATVKDRHLQRQDRQSQLMWR